MRELMSKAKADFLAGVTTNGEHKAFEFYLSEMTSKDRRCLMYLKSSQVYGVMKLWRDLVPGITHKVLPDCTPFVLDGELIDEGQVRIELEWSGAIPGVGAEASCFAKPVNNPDLPENLPSDHYYEYENKSFYSKGDPL